MILTLGSIGLFFLSLLIIRLAKNDTILITAAISMVLSISFALIFIMESVLCRTTYKGLNKKLELQERHDALVAALEENKGITINNQLYKDIQEYNTKVRQDKHYANSLWTNWFYYDNYDDIEYIELNERGQ